MSQINLKKQTNATTFVPDIGYVSLFYSTDLGAWAYKDDAGTVFPFASIASQARSLYAVVRNQTGSTIPIFSVVYISGSSGTLPLVSLSQANSESTSSKTFGVTKTGILNNQDAEVIVTGLLENINTSSFTAGDSLWLSPSVAGGVTTTKPIAPDHSVFIGTVIRSHPTLGSVEVKIQNGYELEELHNVLIDTPTNKQVLAYETATQLWKNASLNNSDVGLGNVENLSITTAISNHASASDPHPGYQRHIEALDISVPDPSVGLLRSTGTVSALLGFADANTSVTPAIGAVDEALTFWAGGSRQATITDSGNFGLGVTNPTIKTHIRRGVSNATTSTDMMLLESNSNMILEFASPGNTQQSIFFTDDSNASGAIAYSHTFDTLTFSVANGIAARFNSSRNLGIGSTSPVTRLHVRGDNFPLTVDSQNSNSFKISMMDNGTVRSYIGANATDIMTVGDSAGTTRFIVQSGGNVGIGDGVAPFRTLDINKNSTAISAAAGFPAMRIVNSNPTAGNGVTTHNFCGIFVDSGNGTSVGTIRSGTNTGGTQPGNRISIGSVTSTEVFITVGNTEAARFNTSRDFLIGQGTFEASAISQINSTTKGFLPPRMTTTEKNAIVSPAAGLVVYDTTLNKLCVRTASAWETIQSI